MSYHNSTNIFPRYKIGFSIEDDINELVKNGLSIFQAKEALDIEYSTICSEPRCRSIEGTVESYAYSKRRQEWLNFSDITEASILLSSMKSIDRETSNKMIKEYLLRPALYLLHLDDLHDTDTESFVLRVIEYHSE